MRRKDRKKIVEMIDIMLYMNKKIMEIYIKFNNMHDQINGIKATLQSSVTGQHPYITGARRTGKMRLSYEQFKKAIEEHGMLIAVSVKVWDDLKLENKSHQITVNAQNITIKGLNDVINRLRGEVKSLKETVNELTERYES